MFALLGQLQNCLFRLLTAQISFVLKVLGVGEKLRVYDGAAYGFPDLSDGFSDRVKKDAAGVLHQAPAFDRLIGLGRRFGDRLAVSAASISPMNQRRSAQTSASQTQYCRPKRTLTITHTTSAT